MLPADPRQKQVKCKKAQRQHARRGKGPLEDAKPAVSDKPTLWPFLSVLKYKGKAVRLSYDSLQKMYIAKGAFVGMKRRPAHNQECSLEELVKDGVGLFEWDGV
jgi:hypothetical protein